MFGEECDYYKGMLEIAETLDLQEVHIIRDSFTADICRRITCATLTNGRSFFNTVIVEAQFRRTGGGGGGGGGGAKQDNSERNTGGRGGGQRRGQQTDRQPWVDDRHPKIIAMMTPHPPHRYTQRMQQTDHGPPHVARLHRQRTPLHLLGAYPWKVHIQRLSIQTGTCPQTCNHQRVRGRGRRNAHTGCPNLPYVQRRGRVPRQAPQERRQPGLTRATQPTAGAQTGMGHNGEQRQEL